MANVLIIDHGKSSLVMCAEILKEKMSGVKIFTAGTAADGVELAKQENPDMILVDFDLPDADGIAIVETLRKFYKNPILLMAFPDHIVREAVDQHLFAYNDSGDWLSKPIDPQALKDKIDHFVVNGKRIGKRFDVEALETLVVAKAEGRGKRAPKFPGLVKTLSMGGACVVLADKTTDLKSDQDITVTIQIPRSSTPTTAKSDSKKKSTKSTKTIEMKVKAKVAWKAPQSIGLEFSRLSEVQRREIETYLRKWQD